MKYTAARTMPILRHCPLLGQDLPNVLPASTGPQYNLTIYNSTAGAHGLSVGLVCAAGYEAISATLSLR